MFAPPASAASASAQMRSIAGSSPSTPSATGQVKSIVCALKTSESTCLQPLELLVAQDRVVDHELARVLRRLVEQVALRADERLDAHHDGLADRIDRRVRDLREELLEVRVHERPPAGEHGERRVVAHRADRLLAVDRERREHHLHVLLRVAEGQLQAAHRLAGARAPARARAGRRGARARGRTSRRTAGALRPPPSPPRRGRSGPARGRRGRACPAAGGPCAGCGRPGCRARRSRRRARPSRRSSRASAPAAGRCGRASRRSRCRR